MSAGAALCAGAAGTHPVQISLPGYQLFDVRVRPVRVDAVHHLLLGLQRLQERLAVGPLLNQLRDRSVCRVTRRAGIHGSHRR